MIALRRLPLCVFWLVLAAALLMRALLPAGLMPVAGAGGIRIELCTGAGPVQALLAPDGTIHPDSNSGGEKPRDPCPFALGGAAPFDLPVHAALPIPPATFAPQALAALVAAQLVVWRSLRPPARGPPLSA